MNKQINKEDREETKDKKVVFLVSKDSSLYAVGYKNPQGWENVLFILFTLGKVEKRIVVNEPNNIITRMQEMSL